MSTDASNNIDLDDERDDSGLDITIVRAYSGDPTVVTGFKGDPDMVPEYVRDNPAALVTGRHGFEFETPVWGHADTFMEMEEAGILVLTEDPQTVEFGPYRVFIYETA